mmetsp:Transcript_18553/g.42069  ORF Transcript_18553/g.42069 Transcript_18553/m.42069 type:complete len:205 (-) Transcript_18553:80-694(-)
MLIWGGQTAWKHVERCGRQPSDARRVSTFASALMMVDLSGMTSRLRCGEAMAGSPAMRGACLASGSPSESSSDSESLSSSSLTSSAPSPSPSSSSTRTYSSSPSSSAAASPSQVLAESPVTEGVSAPVRRAPFVHSSAPGSSPRHWAKRPMSPRECQSPFAMQASALRSSTPEAPGKAAPVAMGRLSLGKGRGPAEQSCTLCTG